jgi:hypothetical protein
MAQPLVPCGGDLGGDVGVVHVSWVLDDASHARGIRGELVGEFPEGCAGEVES